MTSHQVSLVEVRLHRTNTDGFIVTLDYDRPIDAPDTLPAGSMSNTVYTDWRGQSVPMPTECARGA